MQRPVRPTSELPLCLVALDLATAVDEELDAVAQWIDDFYGDRVYAAEKNLDQVARSPAPLEAGAKLPRLSPSTWARDRSSPRSARLTANATSDIAEHPEHEPAAPGRPVRRSPLAWVGLD